jgi:hypothetical protein
MLTSLAIREILSNMQGNTAPHPEAAEIVLRKHF